MKRLKNKKVLIKRKRTKKNGYDFINKEEKEAFNVVEHTKDLKVGTKFVKANCYERFMFSLRTFFRDKTKEIIFSIIIISLTLLMQFIYDKWIKP